MWGVRSPGAHLPPMAECHLLIKQQHVSSTRITIYMATLIVGREGSKGQTQHSVFIVKVTQSCPTPCDPMDYTVHGILQARMLDWVALPNSQEIESRSPALQADSLPAEPQEKPRNTGVGSLSLLQEIFLTQESTWGLLHCRQILYQLNYLYL